MADIELVIKIPEEVYKKAKETHDVMCDSVWLGIKYGTPLPKGHGRLIDADELSPTCRYYKDCSYEVRCDRCKYEGNYVVSEKDLTDAPTIIEADKESEDKE